MILIKILYLITIILSAMCLSLEIHENNKAGAVWHFLFLVMFSVMLVIECEVQNG